MNNYKKVKPISLDVEDFNSMLSRTDNYKKSYTEPKTVSCNAYIFKDRRSNQHLIFKVPYLNKAKHYVCDPYTGLRDDNIDLSMHAGRDAYRRLHSLAKKYNEIVDSPCNNSELSWEPYFEYNSNYTFRDIEGCYEYDQGSSYPSYFKYPLPYGPIVAKDSIVNEGQIGFNIEFNKMHNKVLIAKFAGEPADIIFNTKKFKCMEEYADIFYAEKKACKDGTRERQRIKIKLNALHGVLKYHNVYMSAAIIGYAKRYMQEHKPDNWLVITVDAYVTKGPMTGIPIGDELGQFKIKHENEGFYYESESIKYWEFGEFSHKGLKRSRIGKTKPDYIYDFIKNRMVKNEE